MLRNEWHHMTEIATVIINRFPKIGFGDVM